MSRALFLATLLAAPAAAAAQATNPPYMSQFPSVDKVVKAMEMPDPRESALKKLGALWQLQQVIKQLSGSREFRGLLPDEAKVLGDYQVAEYYIGQAIDSAFPGRYGNSAKVSLNTPYRYMRTDPRFGVEGVELVKVLPVSVLELFYQSAGNDKARRIAQAKADSENVRRAQAQPAPAGPTKLQQEQAAIRRCVESGRNETQCMMEGIGKSFTDMTTSAVPGLGGLLKKTPIHGIRMGGVYAGTNQLSLIFYTDFATVGCGEIVPNRGDYTTAIGPDGVRISISNAPRPIVLTLRADGRLHGPGPTDIVGQVQVGIQHGTRTWSDGRTEPIAWPIFEERTVRCNIGSLAASGGTPAGGLGAVVTVLSAGTNELGKESPAGLRINGEYGTQAALDLEFRPEGVVVGCGAVATLTPYTVATEGGRVRVNVQNGTSPFALTVGADGRLSGTGTVKVEGRQVTGTRDDGSITYAPRTATCPLGVIAPAKAPVPEVERGAGVESTPAAPTSNGPAFQIVGGLPTPASGGNAIAGVPLLLLDTPLDSVVREAGVPQPAGSSATKVLEQTCNGMAGQASCSKLAQAIAAHTVLTLRADAQGVANSPDLVAGRTYYLFGSAVSQARKVTWHLPLKAVPGWTKVVLSTGNAVP